MSSILFHFKPRVILDAAQDFKFNHITLVFYCILLFFCVDIKRINGVIQPFIAIYTTIQDAFIFPGDSEFDQHEVII